MSESKETETRDQGGGKMLAFLLGAVAGGIAALLLAPASGEDTRRRLNEGADRAKQRLGTRAGEVNDMARSGIRQLSEGARQQVGAVKGAVAEGKEAYHRELSQG